MYRPRRTSEFHDDGRDDAGIINKRQTRSQLRPTSTSTGRPSQLLHSSWQPQSRLSQLSQERERGTPLRTGPPSVTKRSMANGPMSANTPMRHRQGSSMEPLHTDKKWVQQQSQLMAEYLNEMVHHHKLQNFPNDFFRRGGMSLRQMTMKQFVGIVNFFLQFVWPNRVCVGVNHVDDITSALHKLRYPHAVNKSWLMTPTTQHSFGHVVVMLDFLKDFAPPLVDDAQDIARHSEEFLFMETSEQPSYVQNTQDSMALSNTQLSTVILNEESNHLLFSKAEEAFSLWDKQKWDEYAALKRYAGDRIINSLCGLPDTAALAADITRKQEELKQLEQQSDKLTKNDLEHLKQLLAQQQQLEQQLASVQTATKEHSVQIEQMNARHAQNAETILTLRKHHQQLQQQVAQQKFSSADFQRLQTVLSDLSNKNQFYKRQMSEFAERSYDQQVRLSRAKKQLLDMVEKFNTHAHNIGLDSDICSASEKDVMNLVLPLPPKHDDIRMRSARLAKLAPLLEKREAQNKERLRHLEQEMAKLTLQIQNLDAALNQYNSQQQTYKQQMDQVHQSFKVKSAMWTQHLNQLEHDKNEVNERLEQLLLEEQELCDMLDKKRQQNEDFLCAIEARHEQDLLEREAILKVNQEMLTSGEQQLAEIEAMISLNDDKITNLKQLLEDPVNDVPRLEDELNEVFQNLVTS